MLRGQHREVLPEWLAALAQAGRRVRDEDLVALLEQGRSQRDLREAIVAVMGQRGRWLAAQNPDWSYATGRENPEGDWQTASREWRLDELKRCRVSDPARARELVASTWDQETPADRAAFLETFAVGLSMDDEPFLESALDDRRAEVRRAAAELLSRLAESRLCRRMIARVEPLVRFSEHKGKLQVDINLPDQYTKDMARDGIAKSQPGMGEKNAWLSQMLAIVPPSSWCRLIRPVGRRSARGRRALGVVADPDRSLGPRRQSALQPGLARGHHRLLPGARLLEDLQPVAGLRESPQVATGGTPGRPPQVRPRGSGKSHRTFPEPQPALGDGAVPCRRGLRQGRDEQSRRPAQLAGKPDPPAGGLAHADLVRGQWSRRSSRSQWIASVPHLFQAVNESLDLLRFRHEMLLELQP